MNHLYQLVWSTHQNKYVVTHEKAKSGGKAGSTVVKQVGSALLGALLASPMAWAANMSSATLPTGGTVTAGSASISASANAMNVNQSSQRAAINWQTFSIGSNASVNFIQPNASAITLNRVVGSETSVIDGAMNANGQVFLLNSSGILFGKGSSVNVGGLVASTLNISDADFMAGKSTFSGDGSQGRVVNFGSLSSTNGGYVALLGKQVENNGVIAARLGTAALAAGDKVSLNFNGDSLVKVTIDQGTLGALVENKNAIIADGGLVVLTADGLDAVMATVVNNTGVVRAQTIAEHEGKIYLLGGMDNDRIEVGGNLDASAPEGGNGGFVETSAARVKIASDLHVSTAAAAGTTGRWLIDPNDFTIAASGGDMTGADIATALATTSVEIDSVSGANSGTGTIYVQDSITKAAGGDATLTLKADRDIVVSSGVSITSTAAKLNVNLSANNDAGGDANITLNSGVTISTNGGNFVAGGALANGTPSNDQQVNMTLGGGDVTDATTYTAINAGAGNITFYAKQWTAQNATTLQANNLNVQAQNINVGYAEGVKLYATDGMTLQATNDVSISGALQPAAGSAYLSVENETSLNAGNTLTIDAGNNMDLYGTSVRMTNAAGTNTMLLKSGNGISLYQMSFVFKGAPDLTIQLGQSNTQVSSGNLSSSNDLLSQYLTDNSTTLYKYATDTASLLNIGGSHFGLKGGSYKLGVYSDFTPQTIAPKSLDNGLLASGNGLNDSIDEGGNLQQPFYYDATFDRYFKLTYSSYPLALAFGFGGTTTPGWNNDGTIVSSDDNMQPLVSGLTVDTTGLANGVGVVKVGYDLDLNGTGTVRMSHDYSLGAGQSFIKTLTKTTNSGSSQVDNARLWVGTYDDWVVISDSNVKTKGNLTSTGFEPITAQDQQARSIIISQEALAPDNVGGAILFHSTNVDAQTVTDSCCSFSNVFGKDPNASDIQTQKRDGSYGIFMNFANMAVGDIRSVTWYYGAGPADSINNVATQVTTLGGGLQIVTPTGSSVGGSTPEPTVVTNNVNTNVITNIQTTPPLPVVNLLTPSNNFNAPTPTSPNVVFTPPNISSVFGQGANLLLVSAPSAGQTTQAVSLSEAREMLGGGGSDRVVRVPTSANSLAEIVNGGVRLPDQVEQEIFVVQQ